MPQTQKDDSAVVFPQNLPPLPANGIELYDSIMQMVEPELVSTELPKIQERFAAEGAESAKTHAKRYMEAFKKFNQIMKQSEKTMHEEVRVFTQSAYASLEKTTNAMDTDKIVALEETFAEQKAMKQKTPEEIMEEAGAPPDPNIA
jgi:polyhydroxyalkanoate synthesis regulator protein